MASGKIDTTGGTATPVINGLTVDVEDWFHGLGLSYTQMAALEPRLVIGLRHILDRLDAHHTKATFFILGTLVAEWRSLLGQIVDAGHEIAIHGFTHTPVYRLSPTDFVYDLKQALAAVSALTNQPLRGYRAPYFSITRQNLWALRTLATMGFTYDASIVPAYNPRYGIPAACRFPHHLQLQDGQEPPTIVEYPISTVGIGNVRLPFSGGFYARLLPYAMIRRAIKTINAAGQPVIFYLHPWELDPDQPRLTAEIPPLYRMTHYYNLTSTSEKLEALLREFRFVPLAELHHR
jgi:polysaccharide deacetylase family protein (PEP-CTERM system associated)